jgi:hypothetical protein
MKNVIKRAPVGLYFILVYFISWSIGLIAAGPKLYRGEILQMRCFGA